MAHSCPDCDSACYCGGDIDDCPFENTEHEANCSHCGDRDEELDYEDHEE